MEVRRKAAYWEASSEDKSIRNKLTGASNFGWGRFLLKAVKIAYRNRGFRKFTLKKNDEIFPGHIGFCADDLQLRFG